MNQHPLDSIFKARSIAVIGASEEKHSVGLSIMRNLTREDYQGGIYPVNPKRKKILHIPCFPGVGDIQDTPDLAVIATPSATVPAIVRECGEAGVKGIVIISAGFIEAGEEGRKRCDRILQTARDYQMRIIGPNCLGFINPVLKINASFANHMALPGKIAFISQSGALCTAILDWAVEKNVGFSNFVSIGSMVDVGFHDLIDYFGNDPGTSSILIYMESLSHARKFMSAARAFARNKPIIILKSGKSAEGAKAALSHTGTLAGNDRVFDAAFKRAGAIRVDTIDQLFDLAQVLSVQERAKGNRLAIITNAGGPGVLATDRLIGQGGVLATLSESTIQDLNPILPAAWSKGNPVDVLGDANAEQYEKAVRRCINDNGVDGLLVIFTPQGITDPADVARRMVLLAENTDKTFLTCWMGETDVHDARDILETGRVPVYETPENAVDSFMRLYTYNRNIEQLYETPASIPSGFTPKTQKNRLLIDNTLSAKRYALNEYEAKQLLHNYDIPVAPNGLAATEDEASQIAQNIGFPVVAKIVSPDIMHKTDIGGVKLGLESEAEVREAFARIMESAGKHKPEADIHGILIEQMQSRRYELLIGSKKDPIFGPVIAFGMGGVAVEVFKDINVGLPPLNMALARRLMEETKIFRLLKGYRGMPGVDLRSIEFLLYKFAYLIADFPEIVDVDINPFSVDDSGGVVLDAKVVLDKYYVKDDSRPYSHLVICPYPKKYVTTFGMKNGQKATLRPIRPEDEHMEAEMFSKFSARTSYFRFFQVVKNISHETLVRYTHNDYDREIAIIAEVEEEGGKKMAGVARLVADAYNDTAEFAIVVADPWHGLGLGNALMDYILEIARERKIRMVYASLMMDNNIMLHMFKKRGFDITREEGARTYHAELELATAEIPG